MDKNMFWTVFKADLTFGICSIIFSMIATVAFTVWKKRKAKKLMSCAGPKAQGPQVIVFGGKSAEPAHCPLCGQGWPLTGPGKQESSST